MMWAERATEAVAMLMIGDGAMSALRPHDHVALWRRGPKPWEEAVQSFLDHPQATRIAGVVELAAGLWLACRSERHCDEQ